MADNKNPGPKLISETKGSLESIPLEFRAKIGTKTTKQQNPPDVEPNDPKDKLIESKVEQIRTDEREKSNTELLGDVDKELVSEVMLQTGQVATETRKLVPEGTPLVTDAKTAKADQRNLGNGLLDQSVVKAPEVFRDGTYETTIPDVVPEEFRVAIPTKVVEETSEGTANTNPVLGIGELSRRESQPAELLKRIRIVTRAALTLPKILTDKLIDGISGLGSRFTGLVTNTRTLNTGLQNPESGFNILSSSSKDLGNGQSLKESRSQTDFPVLTDNVMDERSGIVRNRVKTVVPTGSGNPAGSSQFAQDADRTIRVTETVDSTSLTSIIWRFPGTTNVDLPPELLSITVYGSTSSGAGGYSSSGSYGLSGHGSGGISLKGSCQGSASAMMEVGYDVKHVWGQNAPCTHVLFYARSTDSRATLLGRIGAADFPKFVPKSIVVVTIGGKLNIALELAASATDTTVTDASGVVKLSGSSRTTGGGISFDSGASTKAVRIPETIHGAIGVGVSGQTSASFGSTGSLTTGANAEVGSLSGSASAFVQTGSFPATPGQATIPTGGSYVVRLVTELYLPGIIAVHAEVVDFAALN